MTKLSALAICVLLLTGCSTSATSDNPSASQASPNDKKTSFEQVDQQEFELALSKLKVEKDEFDGNLNILPKFDKPTFTTVGKSRISIAASVAKTAEDSEWGFALSSAYFGEGWMFHDEINMKSDNGILNLKDVLEANRQVQNGGNVLEQGVRELELGEIQQFCKIIKSDQTEFRLRGLRGEVRGLTGTMGAESTIANRAVCVVYAGLIQGLEP